MKKSVQLNNITKNRLIVLLVALATLLACSQQPKESADTIYTNGKIYTVNEDQPWAEAVAIKDGKFIKVGTTTEVESLKGNNTRIIDLEGKFVIPGFIDSHTHPFISAYQALGQLTLEEPVESLKDIFNRNGITAHRTAIGSVDGLIALKDKAAKNELTLHWAVSLDVNYFESTYTFEELMEQIRNSKQYESEIDASKPTNFYLLLDKTLEISSCSKTAIVRLF